MNIYIVATPIGNLEDITLRAINTLKKADVIFAEDTRVTLKLLNRYNIKKRVISFNEHNEKKVLASFEKNFRDKSAIAVVSDAGTPLISDPGKSIVKFAYENKITVIPVPGASSLATLLSIVPFNMSHFIFLGFLEKNLNKKEKQLKKFIKINIPFVFFESPKRVKETIEIINNINNSLEIVIGRELTKKFEEVLYGNICEIKEKLSDNAKGEFIVAVSAHTNTDKISKDIVLDINLLKEINLSTKDIATFISKKYNLKKNEIYNLVKRQNHESF